MSGIAGVIRFDGGTVPPARVVAMTEAMAYRGPDGAAHWTQGAAALGHCMLRTTPESLEETQPLANEDASVVLVLDGRLDNWEEVRRLLGARNATLRTRSDAELLLRAYEIFGRDCLRVVDGDFAFAIWDARRREAFCARDRFGVKPFHYCWTGDALIFSSDLHATLSVLETTPAVNEGMIAELLADDIRTRDETIWRGVMRLVAAHAMVVDADGPRIARYWAPDRDAEPPCRSDADYIARYRELFADAVRRRSRAHTRVAYDVSGGLDSSAVFCMAAHLRAGGRLPAPAIDGYTLDFSADKDADEIDYARAVGAFLGMPIHEVAPTPRDLGWFAVRAREDRDLPGYPNGVDPGYFAQIRASGAIALLTGSGGDHFLEGSRYYFEEELSRRDWPNLVACLRADLRAGGMAHTALNFARFGVFPFLPDTIKAPLRALKRLVPGAAAPREPFWLSPALRQRLAERRAATAPLRNFRCRGQQEVWRNLVYPYDDFVRELGDRHAARAGLEVRHPFFDTALAEFAFATPERLRLRGDCSKYIHVEALAGILPEPLRARRSKALFSSLFLQSLLPLEHEFLRVLPAARADWLDVDGVARLFASYRDHPDEGWQSWPLWAMIACDLAAR